MSQATEQIARQYANANKNKIDWGSALYNVKVYGAVGDGVTDDTQAIQNVINTAIAEGRKAIFFPHGTYKVTALTNADQVVFFGDNAEFVGGYTGSISQLGKGGISSGGSGVNVLTYGAKGDGVTDDSSAIIDAVAALNPNDTLLFPSGYSFRITQAIELPSNVIIYAVGATFINDIPATNSWNDTTYGISDNSVFVNAAGLAEYVTRNTAGTLKDHFTRIAAKDTNIQIIGGKCISTTSDPVNFQGGYGFIALLFAENCKVLQVEVDGLACGVWAWESANINIMGGYFANLDSGVYGGGGVGGPALVNWLAENVHFISNHILYCMDGFVADGAVKNCKIALNTFYDQEGTSAVNKRCVEFTDSSIGNIIESNTINGGGSFNAIFLGPATSNNQIKGNTIIKTLGEPIRLQNTSNNIVEGNNIIDGFFGNEDTGAFKCAIAVAALGQHATHNTQNIIRNNTFERFYSGSNMIRGIYEFVTTDTGVTGVIEKNKYIDNEKVDAVSVGVPVDVFVSTDSYVKEIGETEQVILYKITNPTASLTDATAPVNNTDSESASAYPSGPDSVARGARYFRSNGSAPTAGSMTITIQAFVDGAFQIIGTLTVNASSPTVGDLKLNDPTKVVSGSGTYKVMITTTADWDGTATTYNVYLTVSNR